jgi:hypothetical protein
MEAATGLAGNAFFIQLSRSCEDLLARGNTDQGTQVKAILIMIFDLL